MAMDFLRNLLGEEEEKQNQGLPAPQPTVEQPLPVGIQPDPNAPASNYSVQNPMVLDYLKKLRGDKYSDETRQGILDQNKQEAGAPNWGAGLLSLADGVTGGTTADDLVKQQQKTRDDRLKQFDTGRAGLDADAGLNMKLRDDAQNQDKFARENSPESMESKLAQELAQSMGFKGDVSKMTANQFKAFSPIMEKKFDIEERKRARNQESQDKKELAMAKKNEGQTAGRQALDKDFAKTYNEWTGSGSVALDKNLARLQKAKDLLAKHKDDLFGTSGRLTGRLPDSLRSEESKTIRQDVQAAAQGALKATLGSQFTEAEGERIMRAAYDETLSPEANIAKIDTALKELMDNKRNNDAKSSYFEQNGSLTGFKSVPSDGNQGVAASPGQPPSGGKIKVSNDKETLSVDPADLADALADGYKQV